MNKYYYIIISSYLLPPPPQSTEPKWNRDKFKNNEALSILLFTSWSNIKPTCYHMFGRDLEIMGFLCL